MFRRIAIARPSLATTFRALKHPNYRRWATADFVSVSGAWMQNLGLNWLVLTMTGSAGLLGLSLLFQALPRILLGSWAGAIADRWRARRVLVVTQTLHAMLALALAAVAWTHAPLTLVYGIALLSGTVTVFDGPALGRFASQLVSRDELGNALSLGSVISSGGRILGMSLAGALVGITGEGWLFVLNSLSFVGVLVALMRIRSNRMYQLATSPPERSGAMAGLRYVLGHRSMIVVFLLSFMLSSLGRNYQVTMAAMSNGPLGTGAAGYGVLSVIFAVGTILGGFLAASRHELTLRLLLVMALATSVLQLVSGSTSVMWFFAAVVLPIAAGAVVIDTTITTRVQLDSAEDMRGRVLSAKGMVTAASGAAGGPVLGWLSEAFGPGHALQAAGVVTGMATIAVWAHLARMPERRWLPAEQKWARLSTAPDHAEAPAESADDSTTEERPHSTCEPRWVLKEGNRWAPADVVTDAPRDLAEEKSQLAQETPAGTQQSGTGHR